MNEELILDASVAAKWYLPGEDFTEVANRFLYLCLDEEIIFHAPTVIFYEVGHLLTRAQRTPKARLTRSQSEFALRNFCRIPLRIHALTPLQLQRALALANSFHRNFYDSCYVQLARELGLQWLTSERRFHSFLPPGFPKELVLTLESQTLG